MVRFERYGGEKLALRVLKILEPVQNSDSDYDRFICRPTEGELIQRLSGDKTVVVTRSLNMKDALTLPMNIEDIP